MILVQSSHYTDGETETLKINLSYSLLHVFNGCQYNPNRQLNVYVYKINILVRNVYAIFLTSSLSPTHIDDCSFEVFFFFPD